MSTEDLPPKDTALSIGERLRLARDQQGLSQKAVAERLCLKVSTVRDIEENHTDHLGETFLRGYIRSYARLVRLPEDQILPDNLPDHKKHPPLKRPEISSMRSYPSLKRRKKHDGCLMLLTWLVIIVLLGLTGGWWWQNHKAQQENNTPLRLHPATPSETIIPMAPSSSSVQPSSPSPSSPSSSSLQPSPVQPTTSQQSIAHLSQVVMSDAFASVPATAPLAAALTSPPEEQRNNRLPVPASGTASVNKLTRPGAGTASAGNSISMSFTNECWLDVTDASGKKLFSGLKHRGDQLQLSGQAPYQLIIGAPGAVRIHYQGKQVDLSHIAGNKVARLTLNAAS